MNEALKNIKFDIIGLSEIRRTGTKIEEYENYILCYTGLTQGLYGVGFIVNKRHKESIESFTSISDRVAILNINLHGLKLSLIQVYAPTEAAIEAEIEKFYIDLYKAIEQTHKVYIIMGDLNAKIGQPKPDEHLIMKSNGYGIRNQRGQRLIDFAIENEIAILNTFFKKKPNRRWTWRSPNGEHKNEIDFILSNSPGIIQNIEVLNINYPSDHRPIRATISLSKPKKNRSSYTTDYKVTLKNEEEANKYREYITSYLSHLLEDHENTSIQTYYDKLVNAITGSLQNTKASFKNSTRINSILSEKTSTLIMRRQTLQKTKNKTRAMKNEISALYKIISKHIKHDYASHRRNTIEKHLQKSGSSKRAFKALRTNKSWIEGLKSGEKTTNNRENIINICTEFYKTLYSDQNQQNIYNEHNNRNCNIVKTINCGIPPLDTKEVTEVISKLKIEKSPGPDHITNESIKAASTLLSTPLTYLFNRIIESASIPTQWSETNVILIYKKGAPQDIGNYRPISLLPCLYKIFTTLINRRISVILETVQPVEQAGFRKGFSTIDHIHTLDLLIEKYQEKQKTLHIAFIDYKKAFDTVSHTSIWNTLEEQGVNNNYIQVIKSIYSNSTGRVKLEKIGPSFPIKRGVRQGDPMSPTLFIAVLESIVRKLDWEKCGLYIDGKYLSHLRFADDIVLLSESATQLQHMLNSLNVHSKQVGLEMNLSKTMLMTNSIEKKKISIDNKILDYTEDYIYLGKQISFDRNRNNQEVERRVQLAWNKYWSLKEIFKSNMPVNIKTKVMTSCILPCLTYACQTWKYTTKLKNKLSICQRGMERSMLNIRKIQKIRHTKIRHLTKATDVLNHALKLKWKWAGHVARLQDGRWSKRVTIWSGPPGKRYRGRPLTRWQDEISKIAGVTWIRKAQNREHWKSLEEAFTRGGVLEK